MYLQGSPRPKPGSLQPHAAEMCANRLHAEANFGDPMKGQEMPADLHTGHDPKPTVDVVVIGEALVDIVVSPRGTVEHPGGSPANVAYGLGRLGAATALLTSIGDDHHAGAIENHLRNASVTLLPGSKGPGRTATATAVLASDGSAHYDFDIRWDIPRISPASLPKVLHTGSIATFVAPGATVVRELLEQSHKRCVVTYDPNIRPALLGSHFEAITIFEELIPFTDVIKLSHEDARWLYPELDIERDPGTHPSARDRSRRRHHGSGGIPAQNRKRAGRRSRG